jgi:hypothetical protein
MPNLQTTLHKIKAEELKIGNYLISPHREIFIEENEQPVLVMPPEYIRVNEILEDGVNRTTDMDNKLVADYPYEGLTPIPLTPEMLEKAGFINDRKGGIMVEEYSTASQGTFKGQWQITLIDAIPHPLRNNIQYLHQLQNLYFALTGEELPITL